MVDTLVLGTSLKRVGVQVPPSAPYIGKKMSFGLNENVKIDLAHANLLTGLVMSSKPKTILEIGIGGGKSTDAILSGLNYNQQSAVYTLIDNWCDWGGRRPEGVTEKYGHLINIIDIDERDFVFKTNQSWDFIMSDGDHYNSDKWFDYVYDRLLNPGGILVYHDVNLVDTMCFKNLINIYERCQKLKISHNLFNKNSLSDERCQRGLLVIFK